MPERESDKRTKRYTELQQTLDRSATFLREQDWAERLMVNPDFQRCCAEIRKDLETQSATLENYKKSFFTKPMKAEEADEIRQQVMMWETRLTSLEKFIKFPERRVQELRQIRKDLPNWEKELKMLEKKIISEERLT